MIKLGFLEIDISKITNMLEKTVSVVIPVFNRGRSLREAIMSVLLQTYEKVEIIIVDDGSTDLTSELIGSLAKQNSQVHALRLESNAGKSEAVRVGLNFALKNHSQKYKWVGFLDADQCVPSSEVHRVLRLAEFMAADTTEAIWTGRFRLSGHQIERKLFRNQRKGNFSSLEKVLFF